MDTLKELDNTYLFQNYGRQDLAFTHGCGEYLYDGAGKEYLDMVAGIAVNSLGHAHPAMTAAICDQASRLIHVSNLYRIKEQAELAEALVNVSPDGLEKVLFVNSGAEANEAALKLAVRHTGRGKVIAVENSFHGRTAAALKITAQAKYQEGFGCLMGEFAEYVSLNDIESLKTAFDKDTAAMIIEPIQGEGGIRPCDKEFFQAARDLCDDNGSLLICDEVQTGMGRTGEWFGFQHYDVVPDVISLAKGMGGGFPIGCIISSDEVSKTLSPGTHGTTFGGSPLASAVALAVLRTIESEGLVKSAATKGKTMMDSLKGLLGEEVRDVRGAGLMIGMEMASKSHDLQKHALEKGVLLNVCAGNVVRMVPPLNVSPSSMKKVSDIIKAFMEDI